MSIMRKSLIAAVAALPLIAAAAAHAQSVDYGSMEQLFGEPITLSATGSPQRSTEVPVDMTIISADDIKRSGAHDLPTLLSRVPGIDVLNWSSMSSDVGVRGYDQPMSPRLLVLVNGRQVYLDHYGYTAWSTIPVQLSEIRQIEVVKGPNAALFGFNAVSGVVNIITYNPKYDNVSGGQVAAYSRNGSEVSLVQTFHLSPRIAARLSAGAAKNDEWDNTAGMTATEYRPDVSRATVDLDAVASLTDKTELRLQSSVSNSQVNEMVSNCDAAATKYLTTSFKLDLTSETHIGLIQASAYRNTMRSTSNVGGPLTFNNTVTVYSLQDLFKAGKHTFRLGVEARKNEMPTAPIGGAEVSYTVLAPSAMWAWQISDNFSTDVAIRSDHMSLKRTGVFPAGFPLADNGLWDRDINELSYNAGAVWRLSDNDTMRLMTAKGVQVPTLIELGGIQLEVPVAPGFSLAVMGNPGLEPSVVKNTELSYDHSFTKAKIGFRVFSQTSSNIKGQASSVEFFQYPTATTFPALGWENVADSKMSGFEVSASGKFGAGFRWSADYTATNVSDKAFAGHDIVERRANFADLTPKARANANLGWQGGKWTVDAFVHYTSDFTTFAPNTYVVTHIQAYTAIAANVSYDMGHDMTVSLSGQNLGNSRQVQTAALKVPTTVFLSLSKRW